MNYKLRIIYIIIFCLGLNLSSRGQNASYNTNNNSSYKGAYGYEVKRDFENTRLQQKNLDAFECRAKQKVKDFVDYVNLLANEEYGKELRTHAAGLTKALFVNERIVIKSHWFSGKKMKEHSLTAFIRALQDLDGTTLTVSVVDIKTAVPLTRTGEGYVGRLVAKQTLELKKNDKVQGVSPYKELEVGIVLKRIKKKFGKQEQEIWELFLGDVTVLENP
ncbi:MAG: hypothetical protein GY810_03950 [Aureispira sp.]|nr:hypothetical protein [Aureispira sp.]